MSTKEVLLKINDLYKVYGNKVVLGGINLTIYKLEQILDGDLKELIEQMQIAHQMELLKQAS